MTLIAILMPLFFIQSGAVFEIIQMTHYFVFFCAMFAAFGFSMFFQLKYNKIVKVILFSAIVIATLPTSYDSFREYFRLHKLAVSKSNSYFKTMDFLSKQKDYKSTVIEIPARDTLLTENGLISWYRSSSPAIVAFSNKRSYVSYQLNEFPGANPKPRLKFLKEVIVFSKMSVVDPLYEKSKKRVGEGLRNNKIVFIYSPYEISSLSRITGIKKIYHNQTNVIYKINN